MLESQIVSQTHFVTTPSPHSSLVFTRKICLGVATHLHQLFNLWQGFGARDLTVMLKPSA